MKVKMMSRDEYQSLLERDWVPCELAGDALPAWARSIPADIRYKVYASGTFSGSKPYHSKQIPSGQLIGGLEIYRHAPDDPVELNKDLYVMVTVSGTGDMILIDGPFRDHEHWLNELPSRVQGAEIYAVPKKGDR